MQKFDFSSFNTRNFRLRLISAAVMVPLVLGLTGEGGLAFGAAVIVVMLLGLREWLRLIDPSLKAYLAAFSFAALLLSLSLGALHSPALGLMVAALMSQILFVMAGRDREATAGWITLGIPYMAFSGLAIMYVRYTPVIGFGLMCYLFAVVWGTDIGAYLTGRLVGGPKLAVAISPNKTWSGLLGGMVLAALLGVLVAFIFGAAQPLVALPLALFLAAISQAGDLFKSYFKRRAGVKDSGGLIPGHGGVLDRIDGLVFAAIYLVMFQVALGEPMKWW